jgi:hypothetical protein
MGTCRPYSEADHSDSSSAPVTGVSRRTFTLSATTPKQSSGWTRSGWNGATDSREERLIGFENWSSNTTSNYWRVGMSSSAVKIRTALATRVEVSDDTLTVELADGRTIAAPLAWYPRLSHATAEERNTWRLIGGGRGIHWPGLDEDISVANVLAGQPSTESQSSFKKWLASRAKPIRGRRKSGA